MEGWPWYSRGLLALALSHLLRLWGDQRQRAGSGRGAPHVFLFLRCILFPWEANTHPLCPYPTPTEYSGELHASALSHRPYCSLAAGPQSLAPLGAGWAGR